MTEKLSEEDRAHMARALELAARGLYTTDPNPRVGCVLVSAGEVIGEGWHERAGEAHAEVAAIAAARRSVAGATAYVTLEPCNHTGRTAPCVDALIAARIGRVVCACIDPNTRVAGKGIERLRAAGISVAVGALGEEARALNCGFFSRFERNRPLVRLKLALSLDGRTASAKGGRMWISGEASRADVQRWRARSSAILTGAGTIRSDDPKLNVRLEYGSWVRQPLRVVLDPALTCAADAQVFKGGGALVLAAETAPRASALASLAPDVELERVPAAGRRLSLAAVMERLTAREVNELLVECGPRLAAAFLEAGLVDELILYIAPILLGADAAPLAALSRLGEQSALPTFDITSAERLGEDLRIILRPRAPSSARSKGNDSGVDAGTGARFGAQGR
ncbi:MAG TPA: bifunctional diaminohydroxyphosphoribosylaminopyrimidine deaminase/5-amino-6-(5-phosphoribosylamino)uracil reductase RibD [Steroidobacteraceae bacterium]|nr:bifunctional diaminohydroxyphosphoribosylaminopyrimidine deaminase/5-amino-6-(5-phosphoribosylamino)uracil reductase RibD [Steroidobacteraceae bacterium]